MKKLLMILIFILFSFSVFAQSSIRLAPTNELPKIEILSEDEMKYHEEEIQFFLGFYGYSTIVYFKYDLDPILVIEALGNFNKYEHTTFIIAITNALYKYSEYYKFNFIEHVAKIEFISGDFESVLNREDFAIAAEIANSKDQQEYLNEQRSAK